MRKTEKTHSIDNIFTAALFLLFLGLMVLLLLFGVKIYKTSTENTDLRNNTRTAVSYITAKVRHFDAKGEVYITSLGETQALALSEEINGETYINYIYLLDGNVCELYIRSDSGLSADSGEAIIHADSLSFSLSENLLRIDMGENKTYVSLRTQQEETDNG